MSEQSSTTSTTTEPVELAQPIEPRVPREEQDAARLQQTASLHEKAVQAIANGTVAPVPKKTRKTPERRVQRLTKDLKVHDEVMTVAREIVMGVGQWEGHGYTRIEIVADENDPRWGPPVIVR